MGKNSHILHSLHSEFSRALRFVSEALYEYMGTIGPPSLFTPVEQKRENNKKQTKKRTKRNKDLRKKGRKEEKR